jgi:hypothetical protein
MTAPTSPTSRGHVEAPPDSVTERRPPRIPSSARARRGSHRLPRGQALPRVTNSCGDPGVSVGLEDHEVLELRLFGGGSGMAGIRRLNDSVSRPVGRPWLRRKAKVAQPREARARLFFGIVSGFAFAAISVTAQAQIGTQTQTAPAPHFAASPTSGRAPLTVTFCASAGIGLNFGDGTLSQLGIAQSGECPADLTSSVRHTYTAPGTYQLRGFPCPGAHGAICGKVAEMAGTVKIIVTAGS